MSAVCVCVCVCARARARACVCSCRCVRVSDFIGIYCTFVFARRALVLVTTDSASSSPSVVSVLLKNTTPDSVESRSETVAPLKTEYRPAPKQSDVLLSDSDIVSLFCLSRC